MSEKSFELSFKMRRSDYEFVQALFSAYKFDFNPYNIGELK